LAIRRILVANRGEIAVRIARAAAELGIESVAIYSEDDAASPHHRAADEAFALNGSGPAAYLDGAALVAAAQTTGCDAVHPGYGFLAESAAFAEQVIAAGLTWIGPRPEVAARLGNKTAARDLAREVGVPTLEGTEGPATLEQARHFAETAGLPVMIKAVAGGGGRGMREVTSLEGLDDAFNRASREAQAAFGDGSLYLERLVRRARHLEVQVLGDGVDVVHAWERDCTVQRRHQKLVEIAPAPALEAETRERLLGHALALARAVKLDSLSTIEFLLDRDAPAGRDLVFIEANARLQVEHTVTEEVTGIDLVQAQIRLAAGETLAEIGLTQAEIPAPRGFAIQSRVNAEAVQPDGSVRPASGRLTRFEAPSGPGVRVDTVAEAGYGPNPRFDSLLAKIIVHSTSSSFEAAARKTARVLGELRAEGIASNAPLLAAVAAHPVFAAADLTTRFLADHAAELAQAMAAFAPPAPAADPPPAAPAAATPAEQRPVEGARAIASTMVGTIVSIGVAVGDLVPAGKELLVMDALKMQHAIEAPESGRIARVDVQVGETVPEGKVMLYLEPMEVAAEAGGGGGEIDLDELRPDLAEVVRRKAFALDSERPAWVEKRHAQGGRTVQENLADLLDPDTFIEYGGLVIAAQGDKFSEEELMRKSPADGMPMGIGTVNRDLFGEEGGRVAVLSYDYGVMAGTQGHRAHVKMARMFEVIEKLQVPTIFFTEGGGGRSNDTQGFSVTGLDNRVFSSFARLSGLVPLVGINHARCFAGNTLLLAVCDVIIATKKSSIGIGGPAMIEGGGLGVYTPEEVGPVEIQYPNGVIDILVEDEAEAVQVAKKYLAFFQGPLPDWTEPDQRLMRQVVPENRHRTYDVRKAIDILADEGSVLELRDGWAPGIITSLARIEGRPVGIIANNVKHLSGALDSPGSDKMSRFMQLCDAFDIPVVFLMDTPGIMVGPEIEKTALVRHAGRTLVTAGSMTVPMMAVILRKGYGLGAQAMSAGGFKDTIFTVSWPTGEFGEAGVEGDVRLGFRAELAAIEDPAERQAFFQREVDKRYAHGRALHMAQVYELDDVIDPAETRRWIVRILKSAPAPLPRRGKKRPFIDTW